MPREWSSARELANAIEAKAKQGKNVVLSPETALALVEHLEAPFRVNRFSIDVHASGSAIYQLDPQGEIAEVVAFARNALAARAAFDYLCEHYPGDSFSQRRGAWEEASRIIDKR